MNVRRVRSGWWAAGALVLLAGAAHGAEPGNEADALFEEARALMARGAYAEACPKLERSEALDPGVGTEFNLARCYELAGKLASALKAYERVIETTHAAGQSEREAVARSLAAALEPRVAHVTVSPASDAVVAGLELRLDGERVEPHAWGVARPVDAGPHVAEALAPGAVGWRSSFSVTGEAEAIAVVVPRLMPAMPWGAAVNADAPPASPPLRDAPSAGAGQRVAALLLGGAGLASIGVGTYFGLHSAALARDADPLCPGGPCTKEGFDLRSEARTSGNVATVAFVAGGALVVAALVVWLTAPSHADRAPAGAHLASRQMAEYGPFTFDSLPYVVK